MEPDDYVESNGDSWIDDDDDDFENDDLEADHFQDDNQLAPHGQARRQAAEAASGLKPCAAEEKMATATCLGG